MKNPKPAFRMGALAGALGIALVVAGCTSDPGPATPTEPVSEEWQAVIDAANEEGSVIWYSTAPPIARELLVEAFNEAYPDITVEVRALSFADSQAALQTEHDTGTPGADVVSNVDYGWIYERVVQDDWMADLEGPHFEAEEWADYVAEGKLATAPIGLVTIGWNTDLLPDGEEIITGYESLLDPRLGDGAIGIIEGGVVPVYADWWSYIEEHHAPDFATEMVDQEPKFYPGAASMQPALAAGEIAVGAFTTAADMQGLVDQGAPVDFMVPDPAWVAQNIFWIPQSAGHPNAAQVFMDFFASPEGQAAVAKYGSTPLSEVQADTLGGNTPTVLVNIENQLNGTWVPEYQEYWNEIWGR